MASPLRLRTVMQFTQWIGVGLFLALVTLPTVAGWVAASSSTSPAVVRWLEEIKDYWIYALGGFLGVWLFFLGGCFASFLNVVAWRLPLGRSILGKSRCPCCGKALSLLENMPIMGWLKQEGISRCCQLPIPIRYLLVEILLGSLFLLLGILEIALMGLNLPLWVVPHPTQYFVDLSSEHWVVFVEHLTLICLLFTIALIRYAGDRIPKSVMGFGLIVALADIAIWKIWPLEAIANSNFPKEELGSSFLMPQGVMILGVILVGAGILSGLGFLFERLFLGNHSRQGLTELFLGLVWIGCLARPESMFWVAVIYGILSLGLALGKQSGGGTGWLAPSVRLFVATVVHLIFWRCYDLGSLNSLFR